MKNFGEKMGRKTFFSVFGWVGRKENKWWGPGVFFLSQPKSSPQNKEKTKGRKWGCLMDKNTHIQFLSSSFFPFFFFFWYRACCLFFFLFFFFSFLSRTLPFFFLTRHDFFLGHYFYLLIN